MFKSFAKSAADKLYTLVASLEATNAGKILVQAGKNIGNALYYLGLAVRAILEGFFQVALLLLKSVAMGFVVGATGLAFTLGNVFITIKDSCKMCAGHIAAAGRSLVAVPPATATSIEVNGVVKNSNIIEIQDESATAASNLNQGWTKKQITMRDAKPPVEMGFWKFIDGIWLPMKNIFEIEENAAENLHLLFDEKSQEYEAQRAEIKENLYDAYEAFFYGLWNMYYTADRENKPNLNPKIVIEQLDEDTPDTHNSPAAARSKLTVVQ